MDTAGNTGRTYTVKADAIARSRPFVQGVKDYRAGRWSELTGTWRGKIGVAYLYETGRLCAAVNSAPIITAFDVRLAFVNGTIPPSTPRVGA